MNDNSKSAVAELETTEQLLDYLNGKYLVLHNVYFLQGLFRASNAPELHGMCLDYAKTEGKKIYFFEKKILENGKDVYLNKFFKTALCSNLL